MTKQWFERGHVAIITGGSKGLGKALARRLLECGLSVIIDGRDPVRLEETRKELAPLGTLIAIAGDVADKDHAHALIHAARQLGRLDLLVNNASTLGETPLPPIDKLSEPVFESIFKVNVFAPIHLMQHALPLLRRNELGTIVNITSDAGVEAYAGWGGYGASKAALEHVSRVLSAELEDDRIHVLVVDPGDMNTDMHRAAIPEADTASLADPNTVAGALLEAIASTTERFRRVSLSGAVAV